MKPELKAALNRLTKWRAFFAGWQLGTRPKGDPESDAVRDHREVTMLMRAELNALVYRLIAKGVLTQAEWEEQLRFDADLLSASYSRRFPGITATDEGLELKLPEASDTMKGWKP